MTKRFLTKDNFWNLMFWVLMVAAGLILDNIPESALFLGIPLLIIFLTTVIKIISQRIRVSLNNDNIFININGEPLDKIYPRKLGLVLIFSFFACIHLLHKTNDIELLRNSLGAYIGIIFLFPTLYFIYKNCPISILFYRRAWTPEVVGFEIKATNRTYGFDSVNYPISQSDDSWRRRDDDRLTNPIYSYLPGNIHHHRR